MRYYYYRKARDAAWQILKDMGTNKMPVSVLKICHELGITVAYNNCKDNQLGECLMIAGEPYILLRKNMSNKMKRFVCAHELGHILLEHFEAGDSFSYTSEDRKRGCESEAESFAMRLIAPACVLWGCNVDNAEEIGELCGIEIDYAEKRLRRMKQLYKRNRFLTSTLEKEVYGNFLPFINTYNENKNERLNQNRLIQP